MDDLFIILGFTLSVSIGIFYMVSNPFCSIYLNKIKETKWFNKIPWILVFLVIFFSFLTTENYEPRDRLRVVVVSLIGSIPFAWLVCWLNANVFSQEALKKFIPWTIFVAIALSFFSVYCLSITANSVLDNSSPKLHEAIVKSKHDRLVGGFGGRGRPHYSTIICSSLESGQRDFRLKTYDQTYFYSVPISARCQIMTKDGFLGWEWIISYTCETQK